MFKSIKSSMRFVILALLLGGLPSSVARGQGTNKSAPKGKSAVQRPANGEKSGSKRLDKDSTSGSVRVDQAVRPERPERGDKLVAVDPSEELKRIRDEFKQAQNRFVEEQKELRQKLKEATEDDRARIRSEIQIKRQGFLEAQREAQDEIRRRLIDLKDQLKDHREAVDAAKEEVNDKTKGRKCGVD
jgi:hypothetical protein